MTRLDTLLLTMLFLGGMALVDEKFFDLLPEWLRLIFYFFAAAALLTSVMVQDIKETRSVKDLRAENKRLKAELEETKKELYHVQGLTPDGKAF